MNETLISKVSGIFAVLAIFISCFGLFGLAAFSAGQRKKEIGIRKVLGASVAALAGLLSKDFLRLVAIACLIAFPFAWWMMNAWLQNYQYRITITWWIFPSVYVAAVIIAAMTIGFHTIKTALTNPVTSLRSE
jgi:putative ABC transport system permease protein